MPRLSSASMRSTSSISSSEYPIQASTLGRPSLVQNQPQMYRQSSATPPSSLGSRQSTPPSQYGVMTRPSARPPSPPLPPPPMQQQSLPQVINIFSIFIKLLKNKSNILTGFFFGFSNNRHFKLCNKNICSSSNNNNSNRIFMVDKIQLKFR